MSESTPGVPEMPEMRRTSRDPGELRERLAAWLGGVLPAGADPHVTELAATSANGMSSETILFDAAWTDGGARSVRQLVARLAPSATDVPVFPTYDLGRQFEIIRIVGERTPVPVPDVYWYEPDPAAIGTPFFVMGRVDGIVPPDVMPYNFGDSWLYAASPVEQRRLQDRTVEVLAHLHGLRATDDAVAFLDFDDPGTTPLERHLAHTRAWYEWTVGDGPRSPLVDAAFRWLEARVPTTHGDPVVCWGDARIGNAMYRDFEPVAILDWEMVALGPRELDLTWLVYAHQVFEHIAGQFELPGMPDFLRMDDVAATYEALTGHTPTDLDWYLRYAAVQFGIVFLRTGQRQVHFGEIEPPDDVDSLLHHRSQLEALLAD